MSRWPEGDDDDALKLVDNPISGPTVEQLYLTESRRLTHYFRRHVGNREDVLDLIQETFTRLLSAHPCGQLKNPRGYLQRIARNLLFNRSKKAETKYFGAQLPSEPVGELSVPPDQSYEIEVEDVRRKYRQAVDALSPRTREVFLLHRVQELSYKAISERLEISVSTVEYHIARALVYIGRALDDE
ncbi:RNA polymerase sigma-70 factor (ECF subfamily) [Sphingobium xanthum]|uniref:RNA polymerase sigma factor n=1 Tax=Sphingobium xanthum TaxID=1387165 RepID=UPI001C8B3F1B|nr:sigma-70 family RNA polymerase sigma factor [Sphingobium xanthum]